MAIWQRLYNFVSGTRISSSQVDAELDQIINALNQHTNDIATGDTNTLNFTKQYGLGSTAQDITGQNLNSIDVTGFYAGSSLTNAPFFSQGYLINIKMSSLSRKQIYFIIDSNKTFMRYQLSGTWLAWKEIFQTDLSWTDLTLTNGATVNNSRTPKYTKIGNIVYLQGEISSGLANNTVIATLPTGYRPGSYALNIACAAATGAIREDAVISMSTNGQLILITANTTYPVSLNNVQFIAEQ